MLDETPPVEGEDIDGLEVEQPDWLAIAGEAYRTSTDYLDANYRKQWEKNVALFRSVHPQGSKYHSDAYRARSKLFRPKTRSAMRRSEAQFAQAMFSTSDVITVDPVDQTDKAEDKLAEVWQAILNFRLKHSIPWFLTAVGAFQEAKLYGIVCSRQDWLYEETTREEPTTDPLTGEESTQQIKEVVENRPRCELIEIENIRFDPAAKWYDPVGTSPYFIELMPMYVGDVLEMMDKQDPVTGQAQWKKMERGDILHAGRKTEVTADTTRQAREGNRTDPKDNEHKVREFEIVWVHRNFIKKDGEDYEFYTLTDKALLTDPQPAQGILGRREYRIGIASLEAHRAMPSGDVELGQNLQSEANDVVNQRLDNVKLVLNRGKYVQRNKNTDLLTLKRSYPGRITMTDDVNSIKEETMNDVTGSSYQEQDRINADMDDLLGGFSGGSVMTNRAMNETVGGMQLASQTGNAVSEYSARTFVETWVEPVLNDLIKLIQAYESDEVITRFAKSANIQITDRQSLMKKLTTSVSVGFGSLDPKVRSQTIIQGIQALGSVAPWSSAGIDVKQVAKEIFGVVGYRDGSKFYSNLGDGPPAPQPDPMVELKKEELVMNGQIAMARIENEREIKLLEMALKENLTKEQLYAKLDLDADKHNLDIMREMTRREEIQRSREELAFKMQTGQQGI